MPTPGLDGLHPRPLPGGNPPGTRDPPCSLCAPSPIHALVAPSAPTPSPSPRMGPVGLALALVPLAPGPGAPADARRGGRRAQEDAHATSGAARVRVASGSRPRAASHRQASR